MCDSISILVLIGQDLPIEVYNKCAFPSRERNAAVHPSGNFRAIYVTGPTGAQYKVTPVGELMGEDSDIRFQFGRVAGYLVECNVPANAIGNNRLLVNGVRAAVRLVLSLLKLWLAQNGCTRKGLELLKLKNVVIVDLTLTFLYQFKSKAEARAALYDFRTYSEAVVNKRDLNDSDDTESVGKAKKRKLPAARSHPPEAVSRDSDKTYTSYVNAREFKLSAYVKELDQPGAFMLPLEDPRLDAKLVRLSLRTLRVEVRVYGKWLKDHQLHLVDNWKGNAEAYATVFSLLRETLRLDENIRTRRIKKTTVDTLKLNSSDKAYLHYHLDGNYVRKHPGFAAMSKDQRSHRYSDLRKRIATKTEGIDLELPYAIQSKLSATLALLLVFPGEFVPGEDLVGYVSSRVSLPVAIEQVEAMIEEVLESGTACVFAPPKYTIYRGPERATVRRMSGISNAPLGDYRD